VYLLALGCGGVEREAVRVVAADGTEIAEVRAFVATDESDRREGLRAHPIRRFDQGLLIAFPVEGEVCIENGGVPLAILAIFANSAGTIVAVESFPAGDVVARCHAMTRYVLEVSSGVATGTQAGDRLETRVIAPDAGPLP
jgi:uncharacterized membrane protein (UPF0127 family)